jgi:hypothetical protein
MEKRGIDSVAMTGYEIEKEYYLRKRHEVMEENLNQKHALILEHVSKACGL